jgi:hypothetical protein
MALQTVSWNSYRDCFSLFVLVLELLAHRFHCRLDIDNSLFSGREIGLKLLYNHISKTPGGEY